MPRHRGRTQGIDRLVRIVAGSLVGEGMSGYLRRLICVARITGVACSPTEHYARARLLSESVILVQRVATYFVGRSGSSCVSQR